MPAPWGRLLGARRLLAASPLDQSDQGVGPSSGGVRGATSLDVLKYYGVLIRLPVVNPSDNYIRSKIVEVLVVQS